MYALQFRMRHLGVTRPHLQLVPEIRFETQRLDQIQSMRQPEYIPHLYYLTLQHIPKGTWPRLMLAI